MKTYEEMVELLAAKRLNKLMNGHMDTRLAGLEFVALAYGVTEAELTNAVAEKFHGK